MAPDLVLLSTLINSNFPCLKLIFMVPKVLEPLKFDCINLINSNMVRGYTYRGSNSTTFASLLSWGSTFKEKNLLHQEKNSFL